MIRSISILLLSLLLIIPGSAFTLSNVIITPSENIVTGDQISASFTLKPMQFENYTHNPNNTIQIATTLENPLWTRITVLQGVQSQVQQIPNNIVNIEGWDLAYTAGTGEWINLTLSGRAPTVTNTSTFTVIGIGEYNGQGAIITSSIVKFDKVVISKTDLDSGIHLAERDMKKLRLNIDNATKKGFDTSGAETLYKEAQNGIDFSRSLPIDKYTLGLERLQKVKASIQSAEDLLEKIQTQAEIEKITNLTFRTDQVLDWFYRNASTYPGLKNITANQTFIKDQTVLITGAMNAGHYAPARAQAAALIPDATKTYNDAIALQNRAKDPLTPLWDNLYLAYGGMGVMVLWLLFRKKKKKVKKLKNEVLKDGTTTEESKNPETGSKKPDESAGRAPPGKSKVQPGSQ